MGVSERLGALDKSLGGISPPESCEMAEVEVVSPHDESGTVRERHAVHRKASTIRPWEQAVQGDPIRLSCVACLRKCNGSFCSRCAAHMRIKLLGAAKEAMTVRTKGDLCYCLECQNLCRGKHHHTDKMIPLCPYRGQAAAWVTGEECWAAAFHDIQSARHWRPILGQPFLLYRPTGIRCTVCSDVLSSTCVDEVSYASFCTVGCWIEGGGGGDDAVMELAEAMLKLDFKDDKQAFCLPCCTGFYSPGDGLHKHHDWLPVIVDSEGRRPRVEIASNHNLARVWHNIKHKELATEVYEILLCDNTSVRCQCCRMRLVDGGGTWCTFECSLPQPRKLLPRPLMMQSKHHL